MDSENFPEINFILSNPVEKGVPNRPGERAFKKQLNFSNQGVVIDWRSKMQTHHILFMNECIFPIHSFSW